MSALLNRRVINRQFPEDPSFVVHVVRVDQHGGYFVKSPHGTEFRDDDLLIVHEDWQDAPRHDRAMSETAIVHATYDGPIPASALASAAQIDAGRIRSANEIDFYRRYIAWVENHLIHLDWAFDPYLLSAKSRLQWAIDLDGKDAELDEAKRVGAAAIIARAEQRRAEFVAEQRAKAERVAA